MFTISKSFEFCYGHRVYSQDVVEKYAGSKECPCRRIHGHQGKCTITVETETLDDRGFVIDFKELSFIKSFFDDNIDHRFILSYDDPGIMNITNGGFVDGKDWKVELLDGVFMCNRNANVVDDSFVFVSFNPTSENLAKWIYEGVRDVLKQSPFDCKVTKVEWSETPKTSAIYTEIEHA